jgi:hypothetical protein
METTRKSIPNRCCTGADEFVTEILPARGQRQSASRDAAAALVLMI